MGTSNPYYTHTSYPATGATGSSSSMRSELELINAGFALLPQLSGNASQLVSVNPLASALQNVVGVTADNAGGLALTGALAVAGAVSGAGFTNLFASPPALGGTAPSTGKFTTLQSTGAATLASVVSATLSAPTATALGLTAGTGNGIVFKVNGAATAATLDVNGNLGLGVTPGLYVVAGRPELDLSGSAGGLLGFGVSGTPVGYLAGASTNVELGAAGYIDFVTNGAERARIDTAGNLGLGVTPSAWGSGGNIQLGTNSVGVVLSGGGAFASNMYYNAGYKYAVAGYGLRYDQNVGAGQHIWSTAPSGTSGSAATYSTLMMLDANGNLGLGAAPSGWASFYRSLDISSYASVFGASTNNAGISNNAYFNGTNWIYRNSAAASMYAMSGYTHTWSIANPGTAGATVPFGTAMVLDGAGNLGLGVTPSAWNGSSKALELAALSVESFGTGTANIFQNAYRSSTGVAYKNTAAASAYSQVGGAHSWYTAPSGTAGAGITFTQAMTLDASGNLLVGATAVPSASVAGVMLQSPTVAASRSSSGAATTAYTHWAFINGNGNVGTITTTGTSTTYATSSDYRLKTNVADLTTSGAFIDALQPRTWTWKADGSAGTGFIAHELQAVSPMSVVGAKDAVDAQGAPIYQVVEYGSADVIANLVAEVKSLRARLKAAGIA